MSYNDTVEAGDSDADGLCETSAAFVRWMWLLVAPVIVIVGLVGNFLVIIVFYRLHFRQSSTLLHMFVLAFNDSVILCLGPVRYWTRNTFGLDLATLSNFGCQLNFFVLYTSLDFSAWILVSVTVERVISVHKPLHVRVWFTVQRGFIRLVIILVLLCGLNMHFFFTNGLVPSQDNSDSNEETTAATTTEATTAGNETLLCDSLTEFSVFNNYYFVWIDLFFDSLFPFVLMACSNIFIVASLRKYNRKRPRATTRRELQSQAVRRNHDDDDLSTSQDGFESESAPSSLPNGHVVTEVYETGVIGQLGSSVSEDIFGSANEDPDDSGKRVKANSDGGSVSAEVEQKFGGGLSAGENGERLDPNGHSRSSTAMGVGGESHPGRRTGMARQARTQESLPPRQPVVSWGATRILVLVTSVFLLTTLPNSVYYVLDTFFYDPSAKCSRTNAIMDVVKVVTNLLQYSNYSCNFLLYSSRSRRFRREVKYVFGMVGSRFRRHFLSSVLSGTSATPIRSQHRQDTRQSDRKTSSVRSVDSSHSTKGIISRRSYLKNRRGTEANSTFPPEEYHYARRQSASKIHYNDGSSELSDFRAHLSHSVNSGHEYNSSREELLGLRRGEDNSVKETPIVSGLVSGLPVTEGQDGTVRPEVNTASSADAETSRTNNSHHSEGLDVQLRHKDPGLEVREHGTGNQMVETSTRERIAAHIPTESDATRKKQLSLKRQEGIGRRHTVHGQAVSMETKNRLGIFCPACSRWHLQNQPAVGTSSSGCPDVTDRQTAPTTDSVICSRM